jgi:two-component system, OmpR family, phosphate regulon sensor histidine kinase PhoR
VTPIWRRGLLAPLGIGLLALLIWPLVSGAAALAVAAAGAFILLLWHLAQLDAFTRWAGGALEEPVPEGRGTWAVAYGALYRRVRLRSARQRDLRLALDRFVSGAEALPEGVVVLDGANRIQWSNPRAQTHLGVELRQDLGAPIVNIVRQPAFVQYLATGDFSEPVVIESQRETGMTLSIQVVPFGVEEKLLMSRDITRLEAVARLRRDFIANVSHELKTPLTVLSGFLETLSDLKLDPKQQQRYLALMSEQAQNMQRLVDDLLTLSSLESEHSVLQESEFAIVPLLLEVSADAKALSSGRHEVTLEIRDQANVIGSRNELASAFGNLVSNAVRYTPDGGRIALEWRVTASHGEFSVADTGIGIAAEHIPRLTERFYRVDRSRSRATGGTGLGLAIVKHVLIRHQAELVIDSAPAQGSRFTVRLPARRVRATTESISDSAEARQSNAALTGASRRSNAAS